jgi:Protein of unknown function (DUF3102)
MAQLERRDTLAALAAKINQEHRKVEAGKAKVKAEFGKTLQHAKRAGKWLVEAKERTPHGQWGPWLEANFEFTQRTAQMYMEIYSRWEEIQQNTKSISDLTITSALASLRAIAPPQKADITRERVKDPPRWPSVEAPPLAKTQPASPRTYEDRQYAEFQGKPEFIADQLWELVTQTTARFEDIPQQNPLPEVLDAFEWRQALALLEHKRDEDAARWVEAYVRAGQGTRYDMRKDLGYVLRHNEYAEIGRLEEDAKILREAGKGCAALAEALEAGMKETPNG